MNAKQEALDQSVASAAAPAADGDDVGAGIGALQARGQVFGRLVTNGHGDPARTLKEKSLDGADASEPDCGR